MVYGHFLSKKKDQEKVLKNCINQGEMCSAVISFRTPNKTVLVCVSTSHSIFFLTGKNILQEGINQSGGLFRRQTEISILHIHTHTAVS